MPKDFLKLAHDQGYEDTLVALGLYTKEASMKKEALVPLASAAIGIGRAVLPWLGRGIMAAGRGVASGVGRAVGSRGAGAAAGQAAQKAPGIGSKLWGAADKVTTADTFRNTVKPNPPSQQMGSTY